MYFWISIIHFWISKNRLMDFLKYTFGCPKISWLLDIHSSIFGYPKMNNGYPKMHPDFWISINQFFGHPKSSWILDINNSIYGYPNMNYGYPKIHPDYWISINQFLDIQKSVEYWISIILFLDIKKSNYGYPKIQFLQRTEEYSLKTLKCSRFLDILKSNYGCPKIELWIS